MWDDLFKAVLGIAGSFLTYQLIEVGRKRKVETYWRMEDQYKSPEQTKARKNIEIVSERLKEKFGHSALDKIKNPEIETMADFYNAEYHLSPDKDKRDFATEIRGRLRLLNQMGVLMRKKMIQRDLLYSLVGLGMEIDYPTIKVILAAHRKAHSTPHLYKEFEYLWNKYLVWKRGQNS